MNCSRRDFGKLALGAIPAASAIASGLVVNPTQLLAADKPNSYINGVQIGVITYSYGRMPDQSAEATLKYIVDSNISACELMDGPTWAYAREKTGFTGGQVPFMMPPGMGPGRGRGGPGGPGGETQASSTTPPSWNGQACPAGRGPGGPPPGFGGRGQTQMTPEERQAAIDELANWKKGLSMDVFKDLQRMYSDAGVSIYAVKILDVNSTDEELDMQFTIGKTLGATHLTAELPAHSDTSTATLKKVGDAALRHGMFAAYHTHGQGSMTAFDEAFRASAGNKSNVDFGHFVAAGDMGGTPMDFLNKFHDRIASFHLKDRTLPQHCALNLRWGAGETPIKQILKLVQRNKWPIPATIELEYQIPEGSDSVKEVRKCRDYCEAALA